MGSDFAEEITVEKKADATYKVVGAGKLTYIYPSVYRYMLHECVCVCVCQGICRMISLILFIFAASIIAKQSRDTLLERYQYGMHRCQTE
jgi:hypothetical protein